MIPDCRYRLPPPPPLSHAQIVLPNDLKVMSEEASHEDKRMEVQERGNTVGSMNAWLRYLETEGPGLYAVIAGPVLFS